MARAYKPLKDEYSSCHPFITMVKGWNILKWVERNPILQANESVCMCALFTHRSTGMKMELNKMEWHRIEPTNIFLIHTIHTTIRHTKSNHHQFDIINRQQSVFNFISITCTHTHAHTHAATAIRAFSMCAPHFYGRANFMWCVFKRQRQWGAS